jgi:Immunity protein Imm1
VWLIRDIAGLGECETTSEVAVPDEHALAAELRRLADLEPRVIGIELSTNEYLQIGLGGPWAFVEHVVDAPWKAEVAISRTSDTSLKPESVSFVYGGQDSEISSGYLLPFAEAVEVLVEYFRTNAVPSTWQWELV